jgi:hypothetical protein
MAFLFGLTVQLVESLLLIRLVMIFLVANPDAGFSQVLYGVTAPLVVPFQGVFSTPASLVGYQLDATALLAMLVYALAARTLMTIVRGVARVQS